MLRLSRWAAPLSPHTCIRVRTIILNPTRKPNRPETFPIEEKKIPNEKKAPNPKHRSRSNVLRRLQKKTKRDTDDLTSKKSVLSNDIQDAINAYNRMKGAELTLSDFENDDDTIENFFYSRSRPDATVSDVEIIHVSTAAVGLAVIPKSKYSHKEGYSLLHIPKTVPGDIVTVLLYRHHEHYVECLLGNVQNIGSRQSRRDENAIVCGKFNECNGCDLQMLRYDDQLDFKRSVIQRAYDSFCPSIYEHIPKAELGNVFPSSMEYAYRTKLTPHYMYRSAEPEHLPIGNNHYLQSKGIVDIDSCPIATKTINARLPSLRRDALTSVTQRSPKSETSTFLLRESIRIDFKTGNYETVCLADNKQIVTEKVGDFVFQFPANEFFQNNNSILPSVVDYVRYQLEGVQYTNIVDTYCGSGFFGISLSKDAPGKVFGIEVSKLSIKYANHNAKINGLQVPEKVQFIHGDANEIFTNPEFKQSRIRGEDSVVIMDPSRKGSNVDFLKQLLEFKPKLIIYVSCNVMTQARDINNLLKLQQGPFYRVKDIKGFDFFPQTKHVETIAVIERLM